MRNVGVVLVLSISMTAAGCAHKKKISLPNMIVPVGCASEILLVECDSHVDPPRCKRARVKYRQGCEEIVVEK